ncbi:MAG: amidohydrolase family protein [Clostridiales bacterium]|jgi:N-acetylglucosamine-6-phosphate deacetylase|nr:amidohydrolase family protein [Clostridiales bacterium]OPZ69150.1 MAG: N-acetylglucosamine-6-phosphate deacetylase [Firmicutes bacterium ADurb.Bin467]
MLAVVNAVLVMRDHLIPDGVLLSDGGKIVGVGARRDVDVPAGCEVVDARGKFVGPGLIDMHTHAAGGKYFFEDPAYCARTVLEHGVTGVLPALYFNMTKPEYLGAMEKIREAACPNILGLYMEGPYLNPKFGCDRENNPWRGPIRREDYMEIVEAARDMARAWAVAPEREGIAEFCEDVAAAIPGIAFTVAHSEASPEQIERLIPLGLKIGTHHTNATGDLPKYPECRGVCVDEVVNFRDDIFAELIVDRMGIHVAPYMLRLVKKIKGERRIVLISDACVFDGPVPPGYDGADDINFDFEGEIAGSKLTLDVACRNMMVHTGCSIVDAFRYASRNPAEALGLRAKGELRIGFDADCAIVDNWMNVEGVILKGEIVS